MVILYVLGIEMRISISIIFLVKIWDEKFGKMRTLKLV